LEEELDCKVDLVMGETLNEELKGVILREVVYVQ
jgi:predicted nucleotidyltransferase